MSPWNRDSIAGTRLSDHEIVLEIQELLSATEWDSDTPAFIAELLEDNGYHIEDVD